ncbi:hypothetical protein N1031_04720 [Herbiconiux moechotypicola]|uniref:Transposase n=1 Tax=Herbiconiux moechotypicola TaxID=637393 RepID=A0ABN3D9R9_9MICO|nr:hypothetical protein [Herbiconiux moechotypicola]MCS5729055.1 hypothetical protein [Herbiconiux moechotypicola]
MTADPLATVARELHASAPAAFVAARTARAKQAQAEGERDLAARIRALTKPSSAAWAVNALDSEQPELVERVVELGSALRAASTERDAARLRELAQARQALLAELAREARAVAEAFEVPLSDAAVGELQQSFQAAMVDPRAANAVRSGMLVRAIASDGLGPVDLEGAVAVGSAGQKGAARSHTAGEGIAATGRADTTGAADARRRAAEEERRRDTEERRRREAEEARADADDAERHLAETDSALDDAEQTRAALEQRIRELHDELDRARDELAKLTRSLAHLRSAHTAAARTAAAARREADRYDRPAPGTV